MSFDDAAHWLLPLLLGLAIAVGATLLVPRVIANMPADYFVRPKTTRGRVASVIRWIVGVALVVTGVAMLVLPGPGVVGIVLGLVILDLPLLRRLMVRLMRRPRFADAVNRLRERHGKPPLVLP